MQTAEQVLPADPYGFADSEPKATKAPNWTSFLNENGTTPVVSSVPVASSSSSSSASTLGVSSLPGAGSGAAETQHASSSSSSSSPLHAADTLATDARSSQQGTKASPADPTQSQTSSMLSQAGLPQSTVDTVPEAGLNQPLGLSDKSAQSSQTGAKSSSPEGVPDDWDWETYLHLNPDVAAAYGQDPTSARQHWQEWGQREQRRYKVVITAHNSVLALCLLAGKFHKKCQGDVLPLDCYLGVSHGCVSLL